MQGKIYLCGPIHSRLDHEVHGWRIDAINMLCTHDFVFVDPTVRDYRGHEDATYNEIVELDKMDIRRSDIVLANCLNSSAGTSMEILYAHQLGKIVVTIAQDPVSPWIRYHSTKVCGSLSEAVDWILEVGVTVLS